MKTEDRRPKQSTRLPSLEGLGVGFGKTEDRRPKTEVKNKNSSNQQPATRI